ncbi:hypothetical protein B0T25DRAFT_565605 [Lasiosphaeria hispida]|uniref:Uncharacterized protein n=1 Tax=Lasiosphaeria hispida TaxID=260671 RepID=A0AAJ0MIX0_9PEZI|nr:hypothetical protein B0T25DRAFT_565605 [Lasiosphaeria hispida]
MDANAVVMSSIAIGWAGGVFVMYCVHDFLFAAKPSAAGEGIDTDVPVANVKPDGDGNEMEEDKTYRPAMRICNAHNSLRQQYKGAEAYTPLLFAALDIDPHDWPFDPATGLVMGAPQHEEAEKLVLAQYARVMEHQDMFRKGERSGRTGVAWRRSIALTAAALVDPVACSMYLTEVLPAMVAAAAKVSKSKPPVHKLQAALRVQDDWCNKREV